MLKQIANYNSTLDFGNIVFKTKKNEKTPNHHHTFNIHNFSDGTKRKRT